MATVLVTGAAGFVGSHLLELLEQDAQPDRNREPDGSKPDRNREPDGSKPDRNREPDGSQRIIAWLRPGTSPSVTGKRVQWLPVEMHDREAVHAALKQVQPDAIYHLAGVPHVGDSWAHTRETFAGNVLATHYLFDGLRRLAMTPRVLVTSSGTVYTPADRAIRETDPIGPNSPYGTSKLAQEMVAERAWQDDGIPALIARAFNHVGPRQSPSFVAPSIARQIAEIEAGLKPPTIAMGNLDPKRDITDVRDTVQAYRAMMRSAKPGTPYNVCTGTPVAIRSLVDAFRARARVPIEIVQDPARMRPNDTPLVLGDRSKLQADTGWAPQIPLEQTVEDLLAYWRGMS